MEVPVGDALVGRAVNALAQPIDGKGLIVTDKTSPIERIAPGVIDRQPVKEPLQTGVKAIDAMIPIGRGQRELIIGDRQTGKTAVAIDTIINERPERHLRVCCDWPEAFHGRPGREDARRSRRNGIHGRRFRFCERSCTNEYLAPYAGTAIGEYFRDNKKHALCIYDDLSKHAAAYREISLLLRRPPGREAYPGDVFYLHSRLLERASKLNDAMAVAR